MKKILILLLMLVIATFAFTACGDNEDPKDKGEETPGGDETPEENPGNTDPCANGHKFIAYVSDQNATCTEDGTKTARCERCTAKDTKVAEGSKLGHALGEWQTVKGATCTEDGLQKRVCSNDGCNYTEEQTITALGHSYNTTEFGYSDATGHANRCTVCKEHNEIKPHTPGAEATETDPQTCVDCGFVIAPAVGHTHSYTLELAVDKAIKSAANCTDKATYYKSCACGAVSETEFFESGDALGHDMPDVWTETKAPTEQEEGEEKRECARPGCDHFETRPIDKIKDDNDENDGPSSGNMDPDGWTPIPH